MSKLEELGNLKNKIFSKSDNSRLINLVQVMRSVGGYEVFMNMTLPAIDEVEKVLIWESKQMNKKRPKGKK